MRFDGEWLECDDGIVRPIVRVALAASDSSWCAAELLVDTGADRTVFSANVLAALNLVASESSDRIGGVGGVVDSVSVDTQIRMTRDDGEDVLFRGSFPACTDHESLDMSVLGRDILDMFALVVDRNAGVVAIIGGQHGYSIYAN